MIEGDESELKDSLFSFTNSKELSLIRSHKEVDFFIKQNCYFSTTNLIEKIVDCQKHKKTNLALSLFTTKTVSNKELCFPDLSFQHSM